MVFHAKEKHFEMWHHFTRVCIENNQIIVQRMRISDNHECTNGGSLYCRFWTLLALTQNWWTVKIDDHVSRPLHAHHIGMKGSLIKWPIWGRYKGVVYTLSMQSSRLHIHVCRWILQTLDWEYIWNIGNLSFGRDVKFSCVLVIL